MVDQYNNNNNNNNNTQSLSISLTMVCHHILVHGHYGGWHENVEFGRSGEALLKFPQNQQD